MQKLSKANAARVPWEHVSNLSEEEADHFGMRAYFMQRSLRGKIEEKKAFMRKILDGEIDPDEARQFRR